MNNVFDLYLLSFLLLLLVQILSKGGLLLLFLGVIYSTISLAAGSFAIDILQNFSILIDKNFVNISTYIITFSIFIFCIHISIPVLTITIAVWLTLEWTALFMLKTPIELSQFILSKAWILLLSSMIISWVKCQYKSHSD